MRPIALDLLRLLPGTLSRSHQQWLLLALAAVFILASSASVSISQDTPIDWTLLAIWLLCALLGGLILDRYLPGRDPLLFPVVMFMSGWGLVAIERLAPAFSDRQEIWLIVSVGSMLLAAVFPQVLGWLRRFRYLLLAIALGMLLATIILGSNPSGLSAAPRLWLRFGPLYLQPSELMKIILVGFLASYLAEQTASSRVDRAAGGKAYLPARLLGPMLLMWSLSIVILVWQRDLGTAMLFFIVSMLLLYLRSGDWKILVGGAVLIVLAGIVAYQLFDVVRLRVDIWLNPWPEADGRAYQIVQSLMAFGAGGIFGAGAGMGSAYFIPVVHSDFIFAALAEEWGLLGVVTILSCLGVIGLRGLSIAVAHATARILQVARGRLDHDADGAGDHDHGWRAKAVALDRRDPALHELWRKFAAGKLSDDRHIAASVGGEHLNARDTRNPALRNSHHDCVGCGCAVGNVLGGHRA